MSEVNNNVAEAKEAVTYAQAPAKIVVRKSIDDLFETDEKAEAEEGVIIDYGDFRVRIARAGGANKKYTTLLDARLKPFRRQLETKTMDEKVATKLVAETYADAVILGIDVLQDDGSYRLGILRKGGVVQEYNKANVVAVLIDRPSFFRDIQQMANDETLFRVAEQEADVKNS